MAATDKAFTGSIAQVYERLLVPLIFAPYADDLAARIAQVRPHRILETAAGTGVVTRALAARLPAGVSITASDLNEPMLAQAKATLPDPRVEWRQADALALPFDDASFDVVVCQFGVMFFPDRIKGYAEAHRVLAPGGRLFFNVWDRIEDNEFADVVTRALAQVFPNDAPRFLARTPHGYHDRDTIRGDLQQAGFGAITIDAVEHVSRAPSPREPAIAYCQGTPLRSEIEARGAPGLEAATDSAERTLAQRFGGGAIEGRIRALVVSARAAR
ncbi:class I SAM-dependent methyltransferase [Bradyrhizobium sp.]|uniref:class I SAM-dependent methyltransferase n=1 Tax=Bradyrhizobium sp. TaxID=376 RepID=UPI0040380707